MSDHNDMLGALKVQDLWKAAIGADTERAKQGRRTAHLSTAAVLRAYGFIFPDHNRFHDLSVFAGDASNAAKVGGGYSEVHRTEFKSKLRGPEYLDYEKFKLRDDAKNGVTYTTLEKHEAKNTWSTYEQRVDDAILFGSVLLECVHPDWTVDQPLLTTQHVLQWFDLDTGLFSVPSWTLLMPDDDSLWIKGIKGAVQPDAMIPLDERTISVMQNGETVITKASIQRLKDCCAKRRRVKHTVEVTDERLGETLPTVRYEEVKAYSRNRPSKADKAKPDGVTPDGRSAGASSRAADEKAANKQTRDMDPRPGDGSVGLTQHLRETIAILRSDTLKWGDVQPEDANLIRELVHIVRNSVLREAEAKVEYANDVMEMATSGLIGMLAGLSDTERKRLIEVHGAALTSQAVPMKRAPRKVAAA